MSHPGAAPAEPAAEEGADRESAQTEDAHDQPLLVAPEAHQKREGDDQPVEAGHGFPNTSARATNFAHVNPPVTRSRKTRDRETQPPRRPIRAPRAQRGPLSERQRRLRQRALPLGVVALIAFIFGAISSAGSPEQDMAERFVNDWAHQDFTAMHDELSDSAQAQYSAGGPAERLHHRPAGGDRHLDRPRRRRRAEERQRHERRGCRCWRRQPGCSARSTARCDCRWTAARSPGTRA